MRAQRNPKQGLNSELSLENLPHNEDSGTYSGILGKRLHNETSIDHLKEEIDTSNDG